MTEITSDKRIIFVADWHLPPERTAQTDFFVRFVDEVGKGAERLFVLGDLFDAWVGPRHAARPGFAAAFEALQRLAESGTQVTLIGGNRDFLLDKKTMHRYGLELEPRKWRGELAGRIVHASHGDELTEDDRRHKVSRAITGNFPVSTLVKAMPLCASNVLARIYRDLSGRRRAERKRKKLMPDERVVRAEFASGTDIVVIGHWHEPGVQADAFGLSAKTFVMLGECTDREASYAEMYKGEIQLKLFAA